MTQVQCCEGRQTSQGLHALVCNETAPGQVQCCEGRQTSQGLHALETRYYKVSQSARRQ